MAADTEVSALSPVDDSSERSHVCKICSRAFKRSEHRIRHERIHTQERPYSCRFCSRGYARKDLVVRHERTLHAEEQADAAAQLSPPSSGDGRKPAKRRKTNSSASGIDSRRTSFAESQHDNVLNDVFPSPESSNVDYLDSAGSKQITAHADEPFDLFAEPDDDNVVLQNQTPRPPGDQVVGGTANVGNGISDHQQNFDFFGQDEFGNDSFPRLDFDGLDIFELLPSVQQDLMVPEQSVTPMSGPQADAVTFTPSPLPMELQIPKDAEQGGNVRPALSSNSPRSTRRDSIDTTSTSQLEASLPQIQKFPAIKAPPIRITPQNRSSLIHDLASRLGPGQSAELPPETSLEKCLRAYLDCCHIHMPWLHLRTFKVAKCPSPLMLGMCAIGALYRLERTLAAELYERAKKALDRTLLTQEPKVSIGWSKPGKGSAVSADCSPLWITQSKFLLIFFATFSGDPKAVRRGFDELPALTMEYRFRCSALTHQRQTASDSQNWHDWIELESCKRILYATFVLSNLLTITYGIPPVLSILQDGEVDMPDDEALWNAPTRDQWRLRMVVRKPRPRFTLRDAVVQLMHGEPAANGTLYTDWSPLTATVAMHAISVQMWNGIQCVHLYEDGKSLEDVIAASPEPTTTAATFGYDYVRLRAFRHLEMSLARCRTMIARSNSESETTWSDYEGPLLFNCAALLRIAYARSLTGIGALNRIVLLSSDTKLVERMIADYVVAPQGRGAYWTKVCGHVFEGFCTPVKAGMLLTQKTAALTWSIEHAIAGWDCVLLFTKWTHKLELLIRAKRPIDDAERAVLDRARQLLIDAQIDVESKPHISISGETAKLWASFYDDTWVWGVTPRIGWVLRELAVAYDKDLTKKGVEMEKAGE